MTIFWLHRFDKKETGGDLSIQNLTKVRSVGGNLFVWFGLCSYAWFIFTRWFMMKEEGTLKNGKEKFYLEAKVIGEGKECRETYDEFAEWCEDCSKGLQFEIEAWLPEAD